MMHPDDELTVHPDEEVLAAIALHEPVTPTETEHVKDCARCTETVTELEGLIARVPAAADVELVEPPAEVWTRVAAEVGPQQGDAPAQSQPASANTTRLWSRRAWLIGAAAAGVAVGVAAGQVVPRLTEPRPVVVAQTSLDTLDTARPGGEATLIEDNGSLQLALRVSPLNAGSGFLEVWLINVDLKRMVSIGVLPTGATQQAFAITAELIDQGYRIVDISREKFDDRPQHSGDSVLRGTLV